MNDIKILLPLGRLVGGSLYKANETDAEGRPLVVKSGPNVGKPRVNYYVGYAIPKGLESHWNQTPWGSQIWNVGAQSFPNVHQSLQFAWKIIDGDSQIPNKAGRKPCDLEGHKGRWIVKISGGFAPRVYRVENGAFVLCSEPDYVKCGYFVEAQISVAGNGSAQQPGVYINHQMFCFRAYGPEIILAADPSEVGFGAAPLPPGASLAPTPAAPLPPGASLAPTPAAPLVPVVPNPALAAAAANPQYVGGGTVQAAPPPPAPMTYPSNHMTAAANGITYEAYISAGWSDATLIAHGLMQP
jgi:hypothetical protein